MCVLATLGTLAFGAWRFTAAKTPSALAAGSLALGSALVAGVIATSISYAVPFPAARELGLGLIAAVTVYLAVLVYARIRRRVEVGGLMAAGAVGFVALWFVGFYALLITACAFGDCL